MTRQTKPLNNTEVKNAKAAGLALILYDGDGLELQVTPGGSKLWRFRYYKPFIRKRAMISFGSYPFVSLSEARQNRESTRALFSKYVDPQEHIKAEQLRQKSVSESTLEKFDDDSKTILTTLNKAEEFFCKESDTKGTCFFQVDIDITLPLRTKSKL
ncbi:integrase arm-type DNA-binding domain-containing protein [Pantoea agglomerans]|uniref:integrase arm-type DNA-binding domain-containing protein n=1 Tax=Enterobacter agglomerans TaxID=549 RepID=UPI001A8FC159|nr:integrase arm-type DNA-binding domain-containing protein [Pantoea agglomerans]MBN9928890.1 integrase arm-type DNA-binding domain-containing protein [Pantoea agglomerans]